MSKEELFDLWRTFVDIVEDDGRCYARERRETKPMVCRGGEYDVGAEAPNLSEYATLVEPLVGEYVPLMRILTMPKPMHVWQNADLAVAGVVHTHVRNARAPAP